MRINPLAVLLVIVTTTVGFIGGALMGNGTLGSATGLAAGCSIIILCEILN